MRGVVSSTAGCEPASESRWPDRGRKPALCDLVEEALQRFLDEHPTVLPFGYLAMHLPDGSMTYGARGPASDAFVTLVHVQPDGDRWWVDRWEASGC